MLDKALVLLSYWDKHLVITREQKEIGHKAHKPQLPQTYDWTLSPIRLVRLGI